MIDFFNKKSINKINGTFEGYHKILGWGWRIVECMKRIKNKNKKMFLLNKYLAFSQSNKKELLNIKLMVLIIVNLGLLVIFGKIILLEGINITNNNIALTKMNTGLNPILFDYIVTFIIGFIIGLILKQ